MDDLIKALNSLKPDSQWTLIGDDYGDIQWQDLIGEAPTQKELDDEIKKIKSNEAKAEADKLAAKQSAQTKLAALGLTEEEVASILG